MNVKEFKPTIFFLLKFVGIYLLGNLVYGWFINSFEPRPDPVTRSVARQTSFFVSACGYETTTRDSIKKPTTSIVFEDKGVLAVYEGCNGINTMIIFSAFILAFSPPTKNWLWFLPVGWLIIHVTNLLRIGLLFFVSELLPQFMYFTHKYLFTAFLYAAIFVLWLWWVKRFTRFKKVANS